MDKVRTKRVLIYIPSYLGLMDTAAVEGLIYFINDCWEWKKEGWEFYPLIAKRMFVADARNTAADHALEQGMDYVLFIDDDMVIKPDSRLFTNLIKHDKDITVPLFFHRRQPYAPLIFKRKVRAGGAYTTFDNIMDYGKGLIRVDGAGCGVMLIKTEVFKKLDKPYFKHSDDVGEDLYFCNKAVNAGFKIYCDTSLEVGHIGDPEVSWESTYRQYEASSKLLMKQKADRDSANAAKLVKKVDIIMPCYGNYEISRTAIESVMNNIGDGIDWNLVLINDGADKKLEQYFKGLEKYRTNVKHITNRPNMGWIKSINQGIRASGSEYVLFANNDIEILDGEPGWLLKMVYSLQAEGVGAVGPISNHVMGFQHMDYNRTILLSEHFTTFLIGFCMLVKREAIEKIGVLDEKFGIGGNDDLDYSIRLRRAGYRLKVVRNVYVYHKGSQSLKIAFDDVDKEDRRTRKILVEKWGQRTVDDLFRLSKEFIYKGEDSEQGRNN
jgi:GT2 family glycosyltransferase